MRLALYQPDIPQNVGACLRLAACFAVPVDIIEPCGFPFDDRRLKRAGMDYTAHAELTKHSSWAAFVDRLEGDARLVLLTTKGSMHHHTASFTRSDVLIIGRESAGVPDEVHARADLRVRIPMRPGLRSINATQAAGIVLAEALRQTDGWPETPA